MMSKAEREQLEKANATAESLRSELSATRTKAQAESDDLKKRLESVNSSLEYSRSSANKLEQELESAHSLLDGLPNAPARETEGKESYQRKEIALTTRLASWIAKVAFSEAFAKIGIK